MVALRVRVRRIYLVAICNSVGLIEPVKIDGVKLFGAGFSFTKPLEFFGNPTLVSLSLAWCLVHVCPTGALSCRKSRGPVRVVLDCGDGRSDE